MKKIAILITMSLFCGKLYAAVCNNNQVKTFILNPGNYALAGKGTNLYGWNSVEREDGSYMRLEGPLKTDSKSYKTIDELKNAYSEDFDKDGVAICPYQNAPVLFKYVDSSGYVFCTWPCG